MSEEERQRRRALMAFNIVNSIVERAGTTSVEHVHIAAICAIADTRGLWRFLIDRGFATEEQHQQYLDRGYEELRAQVESHASKIYVADGSGHG